MMAEDVYRQFKEEKSAMGSSQASHRIARFSARRAVPRQGSFGVGRRIVIRTQATIAPDYLDFKALSAAMEEIKTEVREQHQQTRAEVHASRGDILRAIQSSPAECLKLISEFGSLFLIFSLVVRFALHIELVNPAFAAFMLVAFALYWGMAQLKQKDQKPGGENNPE
jgi:hypothetical protein